MQEVKNSNYWIRQQDNLEFMKELEDESIDLIYGDILYGTNKDFGDYKDIKAEKSIIFNFYKDRFLELHRILKPTGAIYVNLDFRIQHWIREMLDDIFGIENLRNEIIWCYKTTLKSSNSFFGKDHDNIYFYTKSKQHKIHPDRNDFPSSESTKKRWGKYADENGFVHNKYFSCRSEGAIKKKEEGGFNINYGIPRDWWEISNVARGGNPEISKKFGKYKTQKPKALLERIIKASSNEGDIVLDVFMGSGTTGEVALELNRKFIGCDIGDKAFNITKERLEKTIDNKGE